MLLNLTLNLKIQGQMELAKCESSRISFSFGLRGLGCETNQQDSVDVVRSDFRPLLQYQTGVAKFKRTCIQHIVGPLVLDCKSNL